MKILFAIKTLNDAVGGAERVFCTIASLFAEQKNNISVLTFDNDDGKSFYKLSNKTNRINITIGNSARRTRPLTFIKRMIALRKEIQKEKPQIVIAFMHSMFIPVSFALIGTKIPVIASEHIVGKYYFKRPLQFILFCLSYLFVKKVTVLSSEIQKHYPFFLQKKMVVVNNPILEANGRADVLGKKKKVIITAGRLVKRKDNATLINAFAQLADDFPNWDLRIAGDGYLKDSLNQQIKNLNLTDRVKILGYIKNIDTEYKNAQLFVIPSKYEGFGLVAAEAMAYGLPAIGFKNCLGVNEIITDNQNGILAIGNNRVKSLQEAMRLLMGNHDLRKKLGDHAYQSIKTKYNTNSIYELWKSVIHSIIK